MHAVGSNGFSMSPQMSLTFGAHAFMRTESLRLLERNVLLVRLCPFTQLYTGQ